MVNVIRGSSAKPVSSQRLAKYFEERTDIEGTLYIGYPIIGFFVTWYGSIGGHKSTKSLSGKRLN